MSSQLLRRLLVFAVFLLTLSTAREAEARRGIVLINTGEDYLVSQKREVQRRTTLMAAPRYQAAVAQYNDHSQIPDDGERLGAVIDGLSGQGIPAQEARDNIVFLCGIETQD